MIDRKTIIFTPILLTLGIAAQIVALVLVILLFVPCLIWPEILNGPYRWITERGARLMARALVGRNKRAEKARRPGVSVPPHAGPT